MANSKPTILQTEQRVPELAKSATRAAYRRVRASGSDVTVVRNGRITRITSDGRSCFVKNTEPRVKIKKGTIITIE